MPVHHRVLRGECVISIAYENGFHPHTIWNHPENAELRQLRREPHVLLPGDVVFVPDKRLREEPAHTGTRHVYRRRGVPQWVRIQIQRAGRPIAGLGFAIRVDGGAEVRGVTDGDGWLRHPITPNAKLATIQLDGGSGEYRLSLGTLDPIDSPSGLAGRLAALGLYDGPASAEASAPAVAAALRGLQAAHGLDPTGTADDPTKTLLRDLVGA